MNIRPFGVICPRGMYKQPWTIFSHARRDEKALPQRPSVPCAMLAPEVSHVSAAQS